MEVNEASSKIQARCLEESDNCSEQLPLFLLSFDTRGQFLSVHDFCYRHIHSLRTHPSIPFALFMHTYSLLYLLQEFRCA